VMYAYIDRKKKLPVTTLLRAIGYEGTVGFELFPETDTATAVKAIMSIF